MGKTEATGEQAALPLVQNIQPVFCWILSMGTVRSSFFPAPSRKHFPAQ